MKKELLETLKESYLTFEELEKILMEDDVSICYKQMGRTNKETQLMYVDRVCLYYDHGKWILQGYNQREELVEFELSQHCDDGSEMQENEWCMLGEL